MRKQYDNYKSRTDTKGQRIKNDVLFQRRIFEDGAQNPDHTKSDRFFRAMINSIGIKFQEAEGILSESFRYDFNSFLQTAERHVKAGKNFHLQRLRGMAEPHPDAP